MTRNGTLLAIAVVASTVVAACDQSPTALPAAQDFEFAALTVPTGTAAKVIVCKEGSTGGPFDFTITANTGSVTLDQGGTFSLSPDQCLTVATATDGLQSVTITELGPPAGTVFTGVDTYRFNGSTGLQTQVGFNLQTQEITAFPFGPDAGWVIVYKNADAPSTGCTLTQGYWKTHSEFGPAPYDATWAILPSGASTSFFLSGQSWYEVFHTPVAGNAYYNLAHQYMAAVLNVLAGAGAPANVVTALNNASTLFNTYTPAEIGVLKGNDAVRQAFLAEAEILGDYNEGDIGPGHCD